MGNQDKQSPKSSIKSKHKKNTRRGGRATPAQYFAVAKDGTSSNDKLTIDQMTSENNVRDLTNLYQKKTLNESEAMFSEKDMYAIGCFLTEQKGVMLGNKLGTGNYAEVYSGTRFKKNDRKVAVKLIKMSDNERSKRYQKNFLKTELEIITMLKHPRIIKTFSMSQLNNVVLIVMEYAAQGTMSDIISQNGALSQLTSRKFFREIISGLWCMHVDHSVAHRDLKLENILVSGNMVPKLADFSFATVFDGKTFCDQYCGSMPYFPPELLGQIPYNPMQSDIWSIGVCLFIMTNDKYPFPFEKPQEMRQLQLERKFTFRERTIAKYESLYKPLMNRMLEPDPKLRCDVRTAAANRWITSCPK